jgi:hypothetical protein
LAYQLYCQEQNSLERKTKMTVNKEVLQRPSEAIDHHRIEASFRTKPMDSRNTRLSIKLCIDTKLVAQGAILAFNPLEFDNNVIPG